MVNSVLTYDRQTRDETMFLRAWYTQEGHGDSQTFHLVGYSINTRHYTTGQLVREAKTRLLAWLLNNPRVLILCVEREAPWMNRATRALAVEFLRLELCRPIWIYLLPRNETTLNLANLMAGTTMSRCATG